MHPPPFPRIITGGPHNPRSFGALMWATMTGNNNERGAVDTRAAAAP